MTYKYVAMWNLPGCLPEMEPAIFDNMPDALEFLADALQELATGEFLDDSRAEEIEIEESILRGRVESAVIGEDDYRWFGPDGYIYSATCQDLPE